MIAYPEKGTGRSAPFLMMLIIPFFWATKSLPSGADATQVPSRPMASLSSEKPVANVLPDEEIGKSKQTSMREAREVGVERAIMKGRISEEKT